MSEDQSGGVSRRTVAKGMAWSVPAVAVATAAPAMASSGAGPTLTYVSACKNPGGSCAARVKGYTFTYLVCNPSSKDIYIYGATIVSSDSKMNLAFVNTEPPSSKTQGALIPANKCITVAFNASSTNSANQSFTMTLSVLWGHTLKYADDTEHAAIVSQVFIAEFPPKGGDCICPTP